VSRPDAPADHVTPYDRFAWSDGDVEHLLATGAHDRELIAYFGASEYRELARLARQAQRATPADPGLRVFVVPGIMGSQLGVLRKPPLPNDILWLDPIDIQVGRLAQLRLPGRAAIVSLGAVLYFYLKLKLHLRAAGFAVTFHDYDWRLGVDELGRSFAERLRAEPAGRLAIVAHSMGGLVSRAALNGPGLEKVERVVLLGTPNLGSFAPLQALRGTYAVVRKIARLVGNGSAESLAGEIFNTFPSLYHMLPVPGCSGELDLLESTQWPASGPQPQPHLLRSAREIRNALSQPDGRFAAIVGVGQETVTGAAVRNGEFVYTITRHGDGTVPAVSAALDGGVTHYVPVAHSDLTRDPTVATAVVDLLRKGATRRLPTKWATSSIAQARISDGQLRRTHADKVDWAALEPEERRVFLQNLNDPPKLQLRVPASARSRKRPKAKTRR
jgi:pimeloyl-ACP methyl ester carboxylesterase